MRFARKLKVLAENELIGLGCEVVKSTHRELKGMKGKIVDETLHTLTIETGRGEKKLIKEMISLKISFPEGDFIFSGKELLQRPHERIKKLWRKV